MGAHCGAMTHFPARPAAATHGREPRNTRNSRKRQGNREFTRMPAGRGVVSRHPGRRSCGATLEARAFLLLRPGRSLALPILKPRRRVTAFQALSGHMRLNPGLRPGLSSERPSDAPVARPSADSSQYNFHAEHCPPAPSPRLESILSRLEADIARGARVARRRVRSTGGRSSRTVLQLTSLLASE